jgi:carboxylesterase type B
MARTNMAFPLILLLVLNRLGSALKNPPTSTTTHAFAPTSRVTVSLPVGTVIGSVIDDVEYFRGISFAQAPVASLRLRPPVRFSEMGTIVATATEPSCPQMTNVDITPAIEKALEVPELDSAIALLQEAPNVTEDCLTLSVMRPQNAKKNPSLPVLVWIYGGGFETGSSVGYNGSVLIPKSVSQGMPIILVTINIALEALASFPAPRFSLKESST